MQQQPHPQQMIYTLNPTGNQPVSTSQRHPNPSYYNPRPNQRSGHIQANATSRPMNMNGPSNLNTNGGPTNPIMFNPMPQTLMQYPPTPGNPSVQPMSNQYNRTPTNWQTGQQYVHLGHGQWPTSSYQQFQPPHTPVYFTPGAPVMMPHQQPLQTAGSGTVTNVHPAQPMNTNPTRERKAIEIINPDTGLAISFETIKSNPQGNRNSATPPNSQSRAASAASTSSDASSNSSTRTEGGSEIAAQFATLVAAAAVSDTPPMHSEVPAPITQSGKDAFVKNKVTIEPPSNACKESAPEIEPPVPTNNDETAPVNVNERVPLSCVTGGLLDKTLSENTEETQEATEELIKTGMCKHSVNVKDNAPPRSVGELNTAINENPIIMQESPPLPLGVKEILPTPEKEGDVPMKVKEPALTNSRENVPIIKDISDSIYKNEIRFERGNTFSLPVAPEDAFPETGGNKKKKGKQLLKNLNVKGKEKEGGEMDAFLDNTEKEAVKESIPDQNLGNIVKNNPVVTSQTKPEQPSAEISLEQVKNSHNSVIVNGPEPKNSETAPIENSICDTSIVDVIKQNSEESLEEKVTENENIVDSNSDSNVDDAQAETEVVVEDESTETAGETQPTFQLKYEYKPGQWSPLNTIGKKQYDRNFLIQLQFDNLSQVKPQGLPDLDVIKDTLTANSPVGSYDFTPGFVQSTNKGKGQQSMQRKSSQSQQGKNNSMRRINLNVEVQLHQSENAWKPSSLRKQDATGEEAEIAKIVAKARTILNKLTPSNFKVLVEHFGALQIDTEVKMNSVIDLLFLKALDEPKFIMEYAQLCKCLSRLKVIGSKGQEVKFNNMILTRCQAMFERDPLSKLDKESRLKEIEDEKDLTQKAMLNENWNSDVGKAKRQMIGNIRFIAELYKLKLLTSNIIFDCYTKLFNGQSHEMSIECLCTLITNVGKDMEADARDKPKSIKFTFQKLEEFYHSIAALEKTETDNRTKFMLRDVVELKGSNWVPRRTDTGPTTIDAIHKQAAREQLEMQQHLQNMSSNSKRSDDKHLRRKGGGYSSSQNANEDGWSTVGSNKPRHTFDPMKLKSIQTIQSDENIQLGPGGPGSFKMWGSGSNGGNRSGADSTSMKPPSNRFTALQYGGEMEDRQSYTPRSGPPSRDSSVGRQGSNSNSGRKSSQPQRGVSKERQDLLNSVSSLTKGENIKRDHKLDSDPEEKVLDPLSEEFQKRCQTIADENIQFGIEGEVMQDLKSIITPKTAKYYISETLFYTLERNENARVKTSQIFKTLFGRCMVSSKDFAEGLTEVLNQASDLILDIPQFWKYISQFIAPIFRYHSSLKVIKQTVDRLPAFTAEQLVSISFNAAVSELGKPKVARMWQTSDLKISDFIKKENEKEFILKNKLEFLFEKHPNVFDEVFVTEELHRLLCIVEANNDEIMAFIECFVGIENMNNPKFIRALIVEVFKSGISGEGSKSILDKDVCAKRAPVCQKFINSMADLELEALYGVQRMLYQMDFPLGAVRLCFDFLYDEEIISEEAFCQWEKDPREKDGHAILMKSLTSFFIWLKEAECENTMGAVNSGCKINSIDTTSRHRMKSPSSLQ